MSGRPNGYTLVELMTVIAITAIMAALAGVMIVSVLQQVGVNGNSRALLGMLQDARTRAITQGRRCGVYIGGPGDTAFPAQEILFSKTDPADTSTQYVPPDAGTDISISLQSLLWNGHLSVAFTSGVPDAGNTVVMFQSDGTPIVTTTTPTGGAPSQYDFGAGQYSFNIVDATVSTAPARVVSLRSDGTARIQ
jgi:prepilin-type N-terminal cleavage/methylation domain-containing protein